ncbi:MAG: FAD-binding protein [Candidatus Eisenbacteria bacterium]|nr:FAD-binding protein [Candidatus Eisenbacteria bacterium]
MPAAMPAPEVRAIRAWLPEAGGALQEAPGLMLARSAAYSLYEALAAQAEAGQLRTLAGRIHVGPVRAGGVSAGAGRAWISTVRAGLERLRPAAPAAVWFRPQDGWEVARALVWARTRGTRVRVQAPGAAVGPTEARPGAVQKDCLVLDLSGLTALGVSAARRRVVLGAGVTAAAARERLAGAGLALRAVPEDESHSVAAWFSASGIGRNSFAHGPGPSGVRAVDLATPDGYFLRLHDDGGLDLLEDLRRGPRHLEVEAALDWLDRAGLPPLRPADLCGSDFRVGVVVALHVDAGVPREPLEARAHFFAFREPVAALRFARCLAEEAERSGRLPTNLEYLSAEGGVYVDFEDASSEELLQAPSLSAHRERESPGTARRILDRRASGPASGEGAVAGLGCNAVMESEAAAQFMGAAASLARRLRAVTGFRVLFLRRARVRVSLQAGSGVVLALLAALAETEYAAVAVPPGAAPPGHAAARLAWRVLRAARAAISWVRNLALTAPLRRPAEPTQGN